MQHNIVGWFEIYVQDMKRALEFYETVFQVKLQRLDFPEIDMWTFPMFPDKPGAPGALVKMEGIPSGGSTLVYFSCEDCANEAARVLAAGGTVFRDKFPIGEHGFIALVVDSEGNMIGLHSNK
jgi:uncharacterized protein